MQNSLLSLQISKAIKTIKDESFSQYTDHILNKILRINNGFSVKFKDVICFKFLTALNL